MMSRKRILILMALFPLTAMISCQQSATPKLSGEQKVNLANTFYNNELFDAAVREYSEYLADYDVDDNRRANINYTIGNIYFERLKDYNRALEYYLRVKQLYPESPLQKEIGKQIVSCLERLERANDAQRVLEKETALKPEEVQQSLPGEVIARIGDKTITQGDLDFEINQLPPSIQTQLSGRQQKLEFLQQYIAEELLYDSAVRKGLDKDKDVLSAAYRAKKRLMAQKILVEELEGKINISNADVELYYKANKERYAEKDEKGKVIREKPFSECAQQVAQDLHLERQEEAYRDLISRLTTAENVQIFEKKIN